MDLAITLLTILCVALASAWDHFGEKWFFNKLESQLQQEVKREPLIFNPGKKAIKVKFSD